MVYDLLWKRSEDKGKARWEKVGILMEKDDGKKSVSSPVGLCYRKGEPRWNSEKKRVQQLPEPF